VVTVTLKESRREKITSHLERRGFISQTSCGLCGKEIVEDLQQLIEPIHNSTKLDAGKVYECIQTLSNHQPLRDLTFASHGAALYGLDYQLLATAEDVGRHNALDKVIGKLFLDHKLKDVSFLILSSRISYELVQKAARARIPVVLAISRPTSLAISLAAELNITLANMNKTSGLNIFCGEHRFI
jgi:FdhD protein